MQYFPLEILLYRKHIIYLQCFPKEHISFRIIIYEKLQTINKE